MEQKIKDGKAYGAILALSSLCTNYFADLDCGLKQATSLGTSESDDDRDISEVLRAELGVLKGEYSDAGKLLALKRTDLLGAPPVTAFYKTWIALALKKEDEAKASAQKWLEEVTAYRKSPIASLDWLWVFEGARRALDAETKIQPAKKELLRKMMAAMDDRRQPLPSPASYF